MRFQKDYLAGIIAQYRACRHRVAAIRQLRYHARKSGEVLKRNS
jgi:hypothetical protein